MTTPTPPKPSAGLVVPVLGYDSVRPAEIPADALVVLGYVDGDFAWSEDDWNRFPNAVKVLVSCIPGSPQSRYANMADSERGDYSPAQVRQFIIDQHQAGRHAVGAYASKDNWGPIIGACRGLAYWPWVADWTDGPHQLPGAAIVQYRNTPAADLNMVYSQQFLDAVNDQNRPWPFEPADHPF